MNLISFALLIASDNVELEKGIGWKACNHIFIIGRVICFVSSLYRKNNGKRLYTCAIRPAAIYGPGEERHFPRIVSFAKLGLLPFKIGDSNVKTDWVYVDNLVLAIILASMGLLDDIPNNEGHPVDAGQPYFISDGNNQTIGFKANLFTI
jgi:nucleoside-diphosphate-sugar epimerase